ncbi:MAG: hypothetical protein JWN84_1130 [Nocardioides sp.]|jgi:hypothetical protein|nr:hypothetical protein [Nocardioides sp.]
MTRRPQALSAAAALVLALSLTACGGDDDADSGSGGSGDSGSEAISKADYVEQGNEICAAGNEELAAGAEGIDPADPESIATYADDVLVPNIRGQLDELRALGYPEGDEETLEAAYADADAALDEVEADPSLLAGGAGPFEEVNVTLTEYGLVECGSSS